jgi:hypothetical protein
LESAYCYISGRHEDSRPGIGFFFFLGAAAGFFPRAAAGFFPGAATGLFPGAATGLFSEAVGLLRRTLVVRVLALAFAAVFVGVFLMRAINGSRDGVAEVCCRG